MTRRQFAGALVAIAASIGVLAGSLAGQSVPLPRLRLSASQLVYQGAFRVPRGSVTDPPTSNIADTLAAGGFALAFNPAGDAGAGSVFVVGHVYGQNVVELSIPPLVKATSLASLNTASVVQPAIEPTNGRFMDVTAFPLIDGVLTGGMLVYGTELLQSYYIYYDSTGAQSRSHFRRPLDLRARGSSGPFQLGSVQHRAGFYSGYMGQIPSEWQSALGGRILVGNCCLSIISRTSYGPAAFAYNPADLGVTTKDPVPLLYYDATHQTLGPDPVGSYNPYFSVNSTVIKGVVFVPGTSTVLFFGRHGIGESCYGQGTDNPALQKIQIPGQPAGNIYCYDPASGSKGGHGYPYKSYVWAYDANEFLLVRAGSKQPWDLKPYAVWPLALPFGDGNDLNGATYDPATGRLYVSQGGSDPDGFSSYPLIHAFTIDAAIPPTITDQPGDKKVGLWQTFAVAATGKPAPTFQWQRSIDGGKTFTNLVDGALDDGWYGGVTTATLTVAGLQPQALAGAQFRCVVSNPGGAVTSKTATLRQPQQ